MPDAEKRTDSQTTLPKVIVGLSVAPMVVVAGLVFVLARRLCTYGGGGQTALYL
jgi:hypothetical protein